jgi:hypothetical protein
MLLKASYFRLAGWAPTQPISKSDLDAAKNTAVGVLGMTWASNLHDLTKWAQLLIEERRYLGAPYSAALALGLRSRVIRIYRNWREYLRYFPNRPYRGEVRAVSDSVGWLLRQYHHL